MKVKSKPFSEIECGKLQLEGGFGEEEDDDDEDTDGFPEAGFSRFSRTADRRQTVKSKAVSGIQLGK